jgi:hypothetical protein
VDLCEYESVTIQNDGFVRVEDTAGTLPVLYLRWHSLGVQGTPLTDQFEVFCTVTGAGVLNPTDPIAGSSPLGTWLGIPYDYPIVPPNQSVDPTWIADWLSGGFTVLNLQFRLKNTTNVLASPAVRLNQAGVGTCAGVGGPGGDTGGPPNTDVPPPQNPDRPPNEPVLFRNEPFFTLAPRNLLLDGSDSLVTLVPANDLLTSPTGGSVERTYQLALRPCAVWSDSMAVDLGIELSGFVVIRDSLNRAHTLWVPNAAEGNVGLTQIKASPNGGYSDYFRYQDPRYNLVRPPEVASPPTKIGRLMLFGDGTVQGSRIYHDPVDTQLGRWLPPGAILTNYSVRVTLMFGQTEGGNTDPLGVWSRPAANGFLEFSAEDDQQRRPAFFKVEVRNLAGDIATWYCMTVVPSVIYTGPTITYAPVSQPPSTP